MRKRRTEIRKKGKVGRKVKISKGGWELIKLKQRLGCNIYSFIYY